MYILLDHLADSIISSGPKLVFDQLKSPDVEDVDPNASDVLRNLLEQKRQVLKSKLQSQVSYF